MSLSLLALLIVAAPAQANVATIGRPAALRPVVEASARCSANPQLVIALTQFTPARGVHSSLVVSLRTSDGRIRELGHAGVFPHQPFSAALPGAQRFGFAIPKAALRQSPTVLVEIKAESGRAVGARAVIGEARITPAPRDRRC
jgi:hypothetical protein